MNYFGHIVRWAILHHCVIWKRKETR